MSRKAFRASFTLAAAGYIGPGDAALGGDFPLGQGRAGVESVAQGDDHGLPLVQALGHAPAHLGAGVPGIQLLQHIIVHADGIQKGQGVPIPVPVDGVGQGHLSLELPLGAEVHQDFICYPHLTARYFHRDFYSICRLHQASHLAHHRPLGVMGSHNRRHY